MGLEQLHYHRQVYTVQVAPTVWGCDRSGPDGLNLTSDFSSRVRGTFQEMDEFAKQLRRQLSRINDCSYPEPIVVSADKPVFCLYRTPVIRHGRITLEDTLYPHFYEWNGLGTEKYLNLDHTRQTTSWALSRRSEGAQRRYLYYSPSSGSHIDEQLVLYWPDTHIGSLVTFSGKGEAQRWADFLDNNTQPEGVITTRVYQRRKYAATEYLQLEYLHSHRLFTVQWTFKENENTRFDWASCSELFDKIAQTYLPA